MAMRTKRPATACTFAALVVVIAAGCSGACGSSRAPVADEVEPAPTAPPSSPVSWQAPIAVDRGDAYAGPWRMNESKFYYVDDPSVDLDRDGAAAVAWVDNRAQNVLFQRFDANGNALLDAPVNVSNSPGVFSWLPRVRVSPDGQNVYVLWQEIVFSGGSHGGETFFARSGDGGRTFQAPINLSQSKAGDGKGRMTSERWHNGSHSLALDAEGRLYAAWTEYEGALWLSRSTDGGAQFSAPVRVAGRAERPARAPDVAIAPDGAVHLAWTVGEVEDADIHIATSTDGGQSFDEPRVLFASDGYSDTPRIAADSHGDVHLAYAESPSGMFGAYHVRYARLPQGRARDAAPTRLAGPKAGARFPNVSVSGDDHVVVVWERYPEGERRPRGVGHAVSFDRGQSFTSPAVVPGTSDPAAGFQGGLQGLLMHKLAANTEGAVALVNSRFKPRDHSLVQLIRGQIQAPP